MADLIDRQAAIEAIKTWGLIDGLSEGQAIEILADKEKLPSAQPERRWISVSERLPERGKDVLVTRDYDGREDCNKSCRYVEIASCYGEDDDPDWTSFSDEYKMHPKNHHVIAWRELPGPYSERRQDG